MRNTLIILSLIFLSLACNPGNGSKDMTVVQPTEIDSSLQNPGRGFTTTGNVYNEDLKGRRHPLSGVIQMRFYWDELEPEEGDVRFAMIDSIIAKARRNRQQLNFRIMNQNVKMRLPQWVIDKGVKRPYYDNQVFLKEQSELIHALAERYDGNPDIVFVDIGSVGQWGEWHTTEEEAGIKMPSVENQKKIIDMYFDSFKKTPLVMLIGGVNNQALAYATSKGAGWRADCWGGWGDVGYNSMDRYPQWLSSAHAYDAWKNGPVALETCYVMSRWQKEGWDLDSALDWALKMHATEVNNGTQAIPETWWPKVKEFEKKLGYRFALKTIKYSSAVKAGNEMKYIMKWENAGVAPIYQSYPLAFRFRALSDSSKSIIVDTKTDITKWMPGISTIKSKVKIPIQASAGEYTVDIGILDPLTRKPMIKLAIQGKTPDNWYRLGKIQFKNP